eukprot:1553540-Rhodomonas_salina.1
MPPVHHRRACPLELSACNRACTRQRRPGPGPGPGPGRGAWGGQVLGAEGVGAAEAVALGASARRAQPVPVWPRR